MNNHLLARASIALALGLAATAPAYADWPSAGFDLRNSRYQSSENKLNAKTVGGLQLKWAAETTGDVTANPAVDGDFLYFPDSAGFLYKLNRLTGAQVWKRPISDYTGITGDFARATPAVAGNALILGNQSGKFLQAFGQPAPQPARVFAVDKLTGAPLWVTQVDNTDLSFVTHSAVIANGLALVGTASNEELVAGFVRQDAGWQWHFRGSLVALDVKTGAIRWQTYMVPEGYYGGAIWGSTGAVDLERKLVYMATGNNYWIPESAQACLRAGTAASTCLAPDNHFDSIVAVELDTGKIRWASRGLPTDAWNVGCGLHIPFVFDINENDNCPNPRGPDWDFAQGPILMGDDKTGGKIVGAGQKSGMFWAFDAKTGQLAWATQAAPGGITGGLQWGSASDGRRIYVAASNAGDASQQTPPKPWKLLDGSTTTAGGWAALDRKTGAVLWTTKDPLDSRAEGAVSAVNDVMFGCSMNGSMYALATKDGKVLWSYASGGMCNAGPSVSDGRVYWGSGTFAGTGAKKLFAFGL